MREEGGEGGARVGGGGGGGINPVHSKAQVMELRWVVC